MNQIEAINAIASYYEKKLQCTVLITTIHKDEDMTNSLGINVIRGKIDEMGTAAGLSGGVAVLGVATVESACNSDTTVLPYMFRTSCEVRQGHI